MFSQIKLYIMIAALIGTFGIGFLGGYKIESASKAALIVKYETAQNKVLQDYIKDRDAKETLKDKIAQEANKRQQSIVKNTQVKLNEATKFANVHCITWGVVQLLQSSIINIPSAQIHLPAGVAIDACSTVTRDTLLKNVIGNYGIAHQNEQQLNDLIDAVNKLKP